MSGCHARCDVKAPAAGTCCGGLGEAPRFDLIRGNISRFDGVLSTAWIKAFALMQYLVIKKAAAVQAKTVEYEE